MIIRSMALKLERVGKISIPQKHMRLSQKSKNTTSPELSASWRENTPSFRGRGRPRLHRSHTHQAAVGACGTPAAPGERGGAQREGKHLGDWVRTFDPSSRRPSSGLWGLNALRTAARVHWRWPSLSTVIQPQAGSWVHTHLQMPLFPNCNLIQGDIQLVLFLKVGSMEAAQNKGLAHDNGKTQGLVSVRPRRALPFTWAGPLAVQPAACTSKWGRLWGLCISVQACTCACFYSFHTFVIYLFILAIPDHLE